MNQNQTESKPQDVEEPRDEGLDETTCSDVWEYSEYRATLRLNGKFFALITPDGRNAISKADASQLLNALNRPNKQISHQ
jgi:hypothetical protein